MDTLLEQNSVTYHYSQSSQEVLIPKPLPPVTQFIIEQLLATKEYTKTSIAKELQVSLVTINRWVAGNIKRPTHKTFSRLLALYCATRHLRLQQKLEAAVA